MVTPGTVRIAHTRIANAIVQDAGYAQWLFPAADGSLHGDPRRDHMAFYRDAAAKAVTALTAQGYHASADASAVTVTGTDQPLLIEGIPDPDAALFDAAITAYDTYRRAAAATPPRRPLPVNPLPADDYLTLFTRVLHIGQAHPATPEAKFLMTVTLSDAVRPTDGPDAATVLAGMTETVAHLRTLTGTTPSR